MARIPLHSVEALKPENIGTVVSIQIFKRDDENSEQIIHDSLTKHVGVLQSYNLDSAGYCVVLKGYTRPIVVISKNQYLEVFATGIRR